MGARIGRPPVRNRPADCHPERVNYCRGLCLACYQKHMRQKHAGRQRAYALRSEYGIESADYQRMLEEQGGRCAICKLDRPPLCVDHCHVSGVVRGLLCRSCNWAMGCVDMSEDFVPGLAAYAAKAAEYRGGGKCP